MPVSSIDQQNPTPQKKSNSGKAIGAGILGGGAVGAATYFLLPSKVTPQKALGLDADTFEKTFKDIPKEVMEKLDYLRKDSVDATIDKEFGTEKSFNVGDILKKLNDNKPITVEELTKNMGEELEELKKEPTELTKVFINWMEYCKKFLETLTPTFNNAKEGVVQREEIKALLEPLVKKENLSSAENILKELGKDIPKTKSAAKASIIGAIAAGVIGSLVGNTANKKSEN